MIIICQNKVKTPRLQYVACFKHFVTLQTCLNVKASIAVIIFHLP